jgi:outer membrane protein assembly factor BamD
MRIFLGAILALSLISCSNKKESDLPIADVTPAGLFESGTDAIRKKEYKDAVAAFETIEREHPASEYAADAAVRLAYAQYLRSKYDDALYAIDAFFHQYPSHSAVPYMHYLRAMCFYEQINDVHHDQQVTQDALIAFEQVVRRYPESRYARDAKLKMDLAFNHLAGKEMDIGNFYLQNGQLIAAVNRFKTVVNDYQTTLFIEEALYRLTEIYYAMGVVDQAEKYAAVLGHNHPNSPWFEKARLLIQEGKGGASAPISTKIIKTIW